MPRPHHGVHGMATTLALLLVTSASAGPLPDDPQQRRCWLENTAARTAVDLREPTAVRFSNLRNGDVVRSPLWVEFGIRGMGVIPAGNPNPRAGHHHMLVDTPLPLNYQDKIPFSDTYKHFGKGQTGTLLELKPGKHTLRLLFADHDHRPYFVYSPELTITVSGPRSDPAPVIDANRFEATCAAWYADERSAPHGTAKEVYVKNIRDREPVASPFNVSLGVVGWGVAPAGSTVKDSGHFAIAITRAGAPVSRSVLSDGRTETILDLPRGDHEIEVSLLDPQGAVLIKGAPMHVTVTRQSP